jgi:hypothetical protein
MSDNLTRGRILAGGCWTGPASDRVMDPILAEQFASVAERLIIRLQLAWGIIANAGGGNWELETEEWQKAAANWRDECWHKTLEESDPNPCQE